MLKIYKQLLLWFNKCILNLRRVIMTVICFLLLILFSAGSFFIYKKSDPEKSAEKAFAIALASILLFSVGLEISVFNINFYTSKGNSEINLESRLQEYKNADGSYTFYSDETVEIPELNEKIKNIHR